MNFSYKIEKSIPIPFPERGRQAHYPFQKMEVGDSFSFPIERLSAVKSARATFYRARGGKGRSTSMRFTIRVVASSIHPSKKVCRLWRVK